MNRTCVLAAAFALAVLLPGCGPGEIPYNDNSQDPLAYARDVKVQVLSAARNAKSSSEPVDYLAPVLQELQRTDRPLGESRAVYADLRDRVEQLVADCQKSGRSAPNLSSRLDDLVKVAQTLPEAPASSKRD